MSIEFIRKTKENKPVIAICYDFDKTLSPDDMQAQGYIQSVYSGGVKLFWDESNGMAVENEMDTNLAYMYKMVKESYGHFYLTKESLMEYGSKVQLFPGVEEWFERIRQYGIEKGVIIEHYIISSGLKEMIEGTTVAQKGAFEKIYASSFYYDEHGVATWPAQVVNYTNKTQFLFRIEKGVLDVNDPAVNDYFPPEDIRVPFRNLIYIGDSDTDIPCMKLVNSYGGHSIGVFDNDKLDKSKVYKMLNNNRIRYFAPADYSDGSELDLLVKAIIDRTAANEILENKHLECKKDRELHDIRKRDDKERRNRLDLILALDSSKNFTTTHTLMKEMLLIDDWLDEECEMLFDIALNHHAVRFLLSDTDVRSFYQKIIKQMNLKSPKASEIEKYWNNI